MRRLNAHVEASIDPWPGADGYYSVRAAVDGRLSWPFDLHESDYQRLDAQGKLADYIQESALTLIHRYGDARRVRMNEEGQIVPLTGEDESATAVN